MNNIDRWNLAQIGEKAFWENHLKQDMTDDIWLSFVLSFFDINVGSDFGQETIVDVGSGPIGILSKLKSKSKIAVDPIDIQSVDTSITRIKAMGENTGLNGGIADRVFLYNVLQHVCDTEAVLNEIERITKDGGTIHILEQLNVPTDNEHLHSLKETLFDEWVSKHEFIILRRQVDNNRRFGRGTPSLGCQIICLIVKKQAKA